MTTQLVAAFPPGDFLAEELDARGWSQADFADIIGRPVQLVSAIVSGKKEITRETASQIGAAFGTSAEYWLNLQDSYELWLARQDSQVSATLDDVRLRAQMNEVAPVAALRKRGFLTEGPTSSQAAQLLALLGIESFDQAPAFDAAARRHNTDEPVTASQRAWLACARQVAGGATADRYDVDGLRTLAATLTRRVVKAEDFAGLPRMLARVGVRLVHVEAFPGTKISGVSFLLDGDLTKPCIALSGRGKRFDKVLFTLLHEIAHVVRGDLSPGVILVDEDEDGWNDVERETNALAASWCLPQALTPPSTIRRTWLEDEARRQGVNPLVIVGRLQHEGILDWKTELVRRAPRVDSQLATW